MNPKDLFKNKNTMSTEKTDKEILENEMNLNAEETASVSDNTGVEEEDSLTAEQKIELELSKEKDKFFLIVLA